MIDLGLVYGLFRVYTVSFRVWVCLGAIVVVWVYLGLVWGKFQLLGFFKGLLKVVLVLLGVGVVFV